MNLSQRKLKINHPKYNLSYIVEVHIASKSPAESGELHRVAQEDESGMKYSDMGRDYERIKREFGLIMGAFTWEVLDARTKASF